MPYGYLGVRGTIRDKKPLLALRTTNRRLVCSLSLTLGTDGVSVVGALLLGKSYLEPIQPRFTHTNTQETLDEG